MKNYKTRNYDKRNSIQAKPLQVVVNNNFEQAFKAFRALVQKEKILSIYKEYQFFEKPSDKKRRKKNESLRKMRNPKNQRGNYNE